MDETTCDGCDKNYDYASGTDTAQGERLCPVCVALIAADNEATSAG